jgi:hypothetical protein
MAGLFKKKLRRRVRLTNFADPGNFPEIVLK